MKLFACCSNTGMIYMIVFLGAHTHKENKVVKEITCCLKDKLKHAKWDPQRPSWKSFQKTLRAASGSSGIDQWTADELKVISHCDLATQAAWNAMMTWEETGLTPETIKEVRIVYVPKDNEQPTCEPKKMRPISVFSFWWRRWPATWLKASAIRPLKDLFPSGYCCGLPGQPAAETLAAVADQLFKSWGHGASLDFSHAFQTIKIAVLERC